nr:uL13 family ribosomal protein [Oligoflexales bacterium]
MKTSSITTLNFKKNWHQVDATDQTLGRLAVQIARLLRGKH